MENWSHYRKRGKLHCEIQVGSNTGENVDQIINIEPKIPLANYTNLKKEIQKIIEVRIVEFNYSKYFS